MLHPRQPGFCALALGFITALAAADGAVAQSCLCGSAADELVAATAGLERDWVVQVPFDSAAWRLEHVVVGRRFVVAQSGDGVVAAIAATAVPGGPAPGTIAWSRRLGWPGGPLTPPGVGDEFIAVARDLDIYGIDAVGRQWRRPLGGSPATGAAAAGDWVYAPIDSQGVLRLPAYPLRQTAPPADAEGEQPAPSEPARPLELSATGRIEMPPVPYAGGVIWCTTAGLLVAVLPTGENWQRLEFDLGSPASGPPLVVGDDVFVATRRGDLARLRRQATGFYAVAEEVVGRDKKKTVLPAWHTRLDEEPEGGPLMGSGVVVLSLGPVGIAGFSAETGVPLWLSPRPGRLLAITGDRFWIHDATGRLAAFDLATGARRERLCLGCFTLPVTSTVANRLVLASPGGLVVSLADPRAPRPVYEPPKPPAPAKPPAEEGGDDEAAAEGEPAADAAADAAS